MASWPFFAADSFAVPYVLALAAGYGLGAVPFGWIWTRLLVGRDIRAEGSGNVGAANALRIGGRLCGLLTLGGDLLKTYIAVAFVPLLLVWGTEHRFFWPLLSPFFEGVRPAATYLAAFGVLIGHCFSFWLRFKGGKGVAVSLGILAVLAPLLLGMALVIWFIVLKKTGFSSLSAMAAFLPLPPSALLILDDKFLAALTTFLFIFIVQRHKDNIIRLMEGREHSFRK